MSRYGLFMTLLGFTLSGLCFDIQAQKYLDSFPEAMISKSSTADEVHYLTEQEKLVCTYINLARQQPQLFLEKVVVPYAAENEKSGSYLNSLKSDLKRQKPVSELNWDKGLYESAHSHAEQTGRMGTEGHAGMLNRFRKFAPNLMVWYGENCSYGKSEAIDIVMQLLIDEDVSDLGHRKNILSTNYTHIGVSIHAHKNYGWTCVLDFGAGN